MRRRSRRTVRRPLTVLVLTLVGALLLAACGGDAEAPDGEGAASPTSPGTATDEAPAEDAPAGDASPVPELSFELFTGESTSLEAYEGQPLVVNFWASWCPPCVDEMPDFEEVNQRFEEVQFLGINTQDELPEARALAEETGVTYPLVKDPDGELFRAFGVVGMPSTYFVSPDGRILAEHTGALPKDALVERIQEHFEVGR